MLSGDRLSMAYRATKKKYRFGQSENMDFPVSISPADPRRID